MARMVKRLSNLDIDEISLVDRPANQHGLVAIAKRDEESTMSAQPLFDVEGYEVDPSQLEEGQYVYDEDGNEYVNVYDDGDDGDGEDDYDDEDGDDVGKAAGGLARYSPGFATAQEQGLKSFTRRGRAGQRAAGAKYSVRRAGTRAGEMASDAGRRALVVEERLGRRGQHRIGQAARAAGPRSARTQTALFRAQEAYGNRGVRAGVYGTGAAGVGAAEYGRRKHNSRVGKSYGQQVLEELSKSYSDDDRDSVISKALDQVAAENDFLVSKAEQLEDAMLALQEEQEFGEFVELAKSYGYAPGEDEEVAEMLYSVAKNDPDYLPVLDRILTSQSEIAKSYMDEIGYDGVFESDALASVYGLADQVVSKADGALSHEQAVTELFASNPALYDEYERDNRF